MLRKEVLNGVLAEKAGVLPVFDTGIGFHPLIYLSYGDFLIEFS